MLSVRDGAGQFHHWNIGEPKPALTGVDYAKADGPEFDRVQDTAPLGLRMAPGAVIGQWVGDLAATVWANV